MLDALNITEEEALGLAELAQHDLAMARDFARRAQAAEDVDEANRLARSYQRAARSYRQTLALKARLRRDLAQADAAAAQARAIAPPPRIGGVAVARRIGDLRTALRRLAWTEAERPETEGPEAAPCGGPAVPADPSEALQTFAWYREDIEAHIAEACLEDDFGSEPLDDDVARMGLRLGFAPEAIARWPDLPDPPLEALAVELAEPDWESSS